MSRMKNWSEMVMLMELLRMHNCEREVYKVDSMYFWLETDEPVRFTDFGLWAATKERLKKGESDEK